MTLVLADPNVSDGPAGNAEINLVGAANVTWCAVQHMIPAGGGRVVNVSSRGAFRGEPGQPAYGPARRA
jgi:NAD(P)-dependent dehydrogenase (short-subunit alcohol dehydrogenase family)